MSARFLNTFTLVLRNTHLQLISYGFPYCLPLERGTTDQYPKEPQLHTERRPPVSPPLALGSNQILAGSMEPVASHGGEVAIQQFLTHRGAAPHYLLSHSPPFFPPQAHAVASYFGCSATPVFFTMSFPRKGVVHLGWILDTEVWLSSLKSQNHRMVWVGRDR